MSGANQRVNGSIKEIDRVLFARKRDKLAHGIDEKDLLGNSRRRGRGRDSFRISLKPDLVGAHTKRPRRWGPTGPGSRRRSKSSYQRENNDGFDSERQS